MFIYLELIEHGKMIVNSNEIHSFGEDRNGVYMNLTNGKTYYVKHTMREIGFTLQHEGLSNG